jgi:hypothetical protein
MSDAIHLIQNHERRNERERHRHRHRHAEEEEVPGVPIPDIEERNNDEGEIEDDEGLHQEDDYLDTKLNELEEMCKNLKAQPNNKEARAEIEARLKKLFLRTGGLPIVTSNPLPVNLAELTPDELVNAVDNALVHINRTRKQDMVSKCINIVSNFGNLVATVLNVKVDSRLFSLVNDDYILREAICGVFLGRNVNPAPGTTLTIGVLSHLSNFVIGITTNINNARKHVALAKAVDTGIIDAARQQADQQTGGHDGGDGGNSSRTTG